MRFYALNTHPRGDADTEACQEGGGREGADTCPACGAFVSLLHWQPPFRVSLKLFGKQFGDLLFGLGDDLLVSQKFRDVYHSLGLTGLTGFDLVEIVGVKSRKKKRPDPPTYFRVGVTYGQTAIDHVASEFEWVRAPSCSVCRSGIMMRWKRLVLEDGTWTGEDAFRPRGLSGTIMVSQQFKDACEEHGISHASFIPAEEAGRDYYPGMKDLSELERFRDK